jgi:hypothetical protein
MLLLAEWLDALDDCVLERPQHHRAATAFRPWHRPERHYPHTAHVLIHYCQKKLEPEMTTETEREYGVGIQQIRYFTI